MKFEMKHGFVCDEDTFWQKLFFDEEYNRRLFREGLDFAVYEPLELKELPSGDRTRRVKTQPKAQMPAPVQKLLGEPTSIEEGRFDAAARRWSFRLIPHKMADKISISGEVRMSPTPTGIERLASIEIKVDLFGIGGLFESFIEKQIRESYDKGAIFTNAYLREKGLAKS
ncbi:MAG: DUF2505 domain-containing protein [Polyangiaceae bacterium]|jgi:hypothetical protein|nr:DUF2505 domain-containing protein [Polyangiaceae bacterium]